MQPPTFRNALARRREQRRLPPLEHLPAVLESQQHVGQFRNRICPAIGIEDNQVRRIAGADAVIPQVHQPCGQFGHEVEAGVEIAADDIE